MSRLITVRVDFETLDAARNAARRQNLNFSEFVRRALKKSAQEESVEARVESTPEDTKPNVEKLFLKFINLRDKGLPLIEVYEKLCQKGLNYDLLMQLDERYNTIVENDIARINPFVRDATKKGTPLRWALQWEAAIYNIALNKLEELGFPMKSVKLSSVVDELEKHSIPSR